MKTLRLILLIAIVAISNRAQSQDNQLQLIKYYEIVKINTCCIIFPSDNI